MLQRERGVLKAGAHAQAGEQPFSVAGGETKSGDGPQFSQRDRQLFAAQPVGSKRLQARRQSSKGSAGSFQSDSGLVIDRWCRGGGRGTSGVSLGITPSRTYQLSVRSRCRLLIQGMSSAVRVHTDRLSSVSCCRLPRLPRSQGEAPSPHWSCSSRREDAQQPRQYATVGASASSADELACRTGPRRPSQRSSAAECRSVLQSTRAQSCAAARLAERQPRQTA